jgi:hypothetical protein
VNSLQAKLVVHSDNQQDFEQFIRLELCHTEGFESAESDIDVRCLECRNNLRCRQMEQ